MNLDTLKKDELVAKAKSLRLTGYSKLTIAKLRVAIQLHMNQPINLEHINKDAARDLKNKMRRYRRMKQAGDKSGYLKMLQHINRAAARWGVINIINFGLKVAEAA